MSGASRSERFTAFYERWEHHVRSAAFRQLASETEVDEVTQVVFSRLWTSGGWEQLDSPAAYLGRAASSEAIRIARRTARYVPLPHHPEATTPAARPNELVRLVREESWRRLESILAALPSSLAEVVKLTILEGLTRREAAERLGCTLEAVEQRLTRAYGALRRSPESDALYEALSNLVDEGGRAVGCSYLT